VFTARYVLTATNFIFSFNGFLYMKRNSSFCCRQSISGSPPKWNRNSHLSNYPGFYIFVNLCLLSLLVTFLVSFWFQLLYLRDSGYRNSSFYVAAWHVIFHEVTDGKGFLNSFKLESYWFWIKSVFLLKPSSQVFLYFCIPFFPPRSVKVVVFTLSQHTAFQSPFVSMSKFSDHLVGETRPKSNICLCCRKWNRNFNGCAKRKGALSTAWNKEEAGTYWRLLSNPWQDLFYGNISLLYRFKEEIK